MSYVCMARQRESETYFYHYVVFLVRLYIHMLKGDFKLFMCI
jgi:hypothetical protein